MKKIINVCLVLLLLIPLAYAQENNETINEQINLLNISKCFGNVEIKVRGDNLTQDDYKFIGCTTTDAIMWTCVCPNKPMNIILEETTDRYNNLDIVIEYDIEYESDSTANAQPNRRTHNFNNIEINIDNKFGLTKSKISFKMPQLENCLTIAFII